MSEHSRVERGAARRRAAGAAAMLALALMLSPAAAWAEVRLGPLVGDHAVVQRERPIEVRGSAAPRERISVELAGATVRARADRSGNWRAVLPAMPAGGPHTLTARGASGEDSASDILVGDVYLCSGQSNMEFQTRYATNASSVLGGAQSDSIRLFTAPRDTAPTARSQFASEPQWLRANAESVGDFSAVCYFFAREIQEAANAPIGLINASWGGTRIEAWMSVPTLRQAGVPESELRTLADAVADPDGARVRFDAALRAWWLEREAGGRAGWGGADFDDARWPDMNLGGFWEQSGQSALSLFDGVVWFRTRFSLTEAQAAQGATLTLGPIDDIDITLINGQAVGAQGGWDTPRSYTLAPGVLRAGENTIAVGVLDTGGGGGLWGEVGVRALRFADGSSVSLEQPWKYQVSSQLWETPAPPSPPWGGPNGLAALYNAMIAPLDGAHLRGVLWYQGEANAGDAQTYARLLPAMMRNWRELFDDPELPFFVAQLADFGAPASTPQPHSWGALRDAQRRVVAADAHAGLAVTIDIGDRFDIHPTQKFVVAQRLARAARRQIYAEAVADQGPAPIGARRAGDEVIVEFANGPLVTYSASRPIAFELCDDASACRFVDARVEGAGIRLDARGGASAKVRYCWGDAPICNLYNRDDLPAVPFELAVTQ